MYAAVADKIRASRDIEKIVSTVEKAGIRIGGLIYGIWSVRSVRILIRDKIMFTRNCKGNIGTKNNKY